MAWAGYTEAGLAIASTIGEADRNFGDLLNGDLPILVGQSNDQLDLRPGSPYIAGRMQNAGYRRSGGTMLLNYGAGIESAFGLHADGMPGDEQPDEINALEILEGAAFIFMVPMLRPVLNADLDKYIKPAEKSVDNEYLDTTTYKGIVSRRQTLYFRVSGGVALAHLVQTSPPDSRRKAELTSFIRHRS